MALDFNGSNQFIQGSPSPITAYPFSMSAWFNKPDITNNHAICGVYYTGAGTGAWYLRAAGGVSGDPVQAGAGSAPSSGAQSTTGYSASTWHHAAGTWTNTTSRAAFIDGGSKGTTAVADNGTIANANVITIGRFSDSTPGSYSYGKVCEVGMWNIVLSDAEIALLAKGWSPLAIRPDALVSYVPVTGRHSPEPDLISTASLTLFNSPVTATHAPVAYTLRKPHISMRSAFPLDNARQLVSLMPRLAVPPASNYGLFDVRNNHPVIAFDDTTAQSTVFDAIMPQQYRGGDIAVLLRTSGATATSGDAKVGVEVERVGDGQQDVDSDSFGGQGKLHFPVPSTSGYVTTTQINLITAAARDSIAAGEKFRLKFTRVADEAQDDMSGDLELHGIELRELV
jgi:hypothetical protein